ncbi:hypothetical protein AB205_0201630 [Aquarana catesbeiana]|uniref:Uncharacterized protein n=1 Tax=Aquarana catesbeiana TaxID=8400 RepID=A0A2G9SLG3_AQUCT|nr:hypothetical protein AB205_0201630 [Aquarana catesbeiana]
MVIIISLLLIRRKPYGTISHGIIEVRSFLCPRGQAPEQDAEPGLRKPNLQIPGREQLRAGAGVSAGSIIFGQKGRGFTSGEVQYRSRGGGQTGNI